MNLGIVANCHVQGLMGILSKLDGVELAVPVPIHLYGTQHFAKAAKEFDALVEKPDAVIVSFENSKRFGDFETARLRQKHSPLYTITNIYFSGLHPDMTYLGDQGGRIQSPVGEYHSKLVLHSYLKGLSSKECTVRFNAKEFERRGFFLEYEKSRNELIERDRTLDIQFATTFFDFIRDVPSLYTVNHPTGAVFQEFGAIIAKRLDLKVARFPLEMLPNPLANMTWWPVYEPVAEFHGLKYMAPMLFKQPESHGGRYLDLQQFVAASYALYDNVRPRIEKARQTLSLSAEWRE